VTRRTRYKYDEYSRVERIQYPGITFFGTGSGPLVEYDYDAYGHTVAVHEGRYDQEIWRLDEVNGLGSAEHVTWGNGLETSYGHDALGLQVESISTNPGDASGSEAIQDWEYEWLPSGRMETRRDVRTGWTEEFAYDGQQQLETVRKLLGGAEQGEEVLTYAPSGDIAFRTGVGAYQYDTSGHLLKAGDEEFTFEQGGRVSQISGGDRSVSLVYDANDRVIEAAAGDESLSARYDILGGEYYRDQNGMETVRFADGYSLRRDFEEGVYEGRSFVTVDGVAVAEVRQSIDDLLQSKYSFLFLHNDVSGSLDVATDVNGDVVERKSYDAWGRERDADDWGEEAEQLTSLASVGYQGYLEDDLADLLFPGGRPLDTRTGRFLRSDPFAAAPGVTEGWNRYAYALNDPVNLSDPSGLASDNDKDEVDRGSVDQEVYDKLPGVNDWTDLVHSILMGELSGTNVSGGLYVNLDDGTRFEAKKGEDGKIHAYILSASGASPDEGQSTEGGAGGAAAPPPPGTDLTPGSGITDPVGAGIRGFMDGLGSSVVARVAFAIAGAVFSPAAVVAGALALSAYSAFQFIESGGVEQMRGMGDRLMAGTLTDQDIESVGRTIGGLVGGKIPQPVVGAAAAATTTAAKAALSRRQTGSYTNLHASGRTYHGKGTKSRSQRSGRKTAKEHDDPHVATDWTPANGRRAAFKQESRRIDADGGVRSGTNYNKIESPGKKYRIQDGEL
jgi:RHS repeat-associated protein